MTFCIALNNPFSIERHYTNFKGQSLMQDDPRFIRFETIADGLIAGMKIILSHRSDDDLEHIAAFMARYGRPADIHAGNYINDVCQHCGVGPTDYFDVEVPDNLIRLAQAIVRHEQGPCADPAVPFWYTDAVYEAAAMGALP
jgi:hypothetical protein